uniref:protein-tyrosine-phosphatase n=1 Tax=Cyprinus carpio TaxID=7962 RepID=A0A8C1JEF2_CYPCA
RLQSTFPLRIQENAQLQSQSRSRQCQNGSLPGETCLRVIPCTCSRGVKHSWSRLKVDMTDLPDTVQEGLALKHRCFEDINECIDASTEKRKRVLVHCRDGFSLAPTCIIQYLMVKQNMRLIAAYELLRARHPVNIRDSHQNVLVSLERYYQLNISNTLHCIWQYKAQPLLASLFI